MKLKLQKEGQPVNAIRPNSRGGHWVALALCGAVLAAVIMQKIIPGQADSSGSFSPIWIPIAATVFAAAGILQLNYNPRFVRLQRGLLWCGLLLMVWSSNGLIFDLLRLTPLMPTGMQWPGFIIHSLALAAVIVLARIALAQPAATESMNIPAWYGYAAFVLALPYPVLRTCWAFGGTLGLTHAGAAGSGFAPLLIAIPWILAAVLSLLLIPARARIPRRLLLAAGWSATAIVAMIGPGAFWSMITMLVEGRDPGISGMAIWVPCLFYSSWFFWAIAAGAATRSYQLRSAGLKHVPLETLSGTNSRPGN